MGYGCFAFFGQTINPYEIIMMNTEKTLGSKNWNIFLYTLLHTPELNSNLLLGDYAFQGNRLKIKNAEKEIECLNDKYVLYENESVTEFPIAQIDGIDIEDRVDVGKDIILGIINEI